MNFQIKNSGWSKKIYNNLFILFCFYLSLPVIQYVLFKKTDGFTFESFANGIFGIFAGLFFILITYFPSKLPILKLKGKKCLVCFKEATDVLVINSNRKENYCRSHLISKFSEYFKSFSYNMILFHPEQEREYCGSMYPYYPIEEFEKYNLPKEDKFKSQEILRGINGPCMQCENHQAKIAYFKKGILGWDDGGPAIRNIKEKPTLLCNDCAFSFIEQTLRNNKYFFVDNGLLTPYKGEGVYVNTYL